ncbi:MAG: hypothetical protein HC923_03330, partial [Myxococcales bacterium]|nr:hypothetical protein [Myxococcales bacterium]
MRRRALALGAFLYVALGMVVMSLPHPQQLTDGHRWESPRTRRELASWGALVGLSAEEMEAA